MSAGAATSTRSVSFVVVNRDDRQVEATLSALREVSSSTRHRTETVVVDASEGRLDDIRDRFPEVTWLPFTPQPGRTTIPEQRNVAVGASTGEIVVFIDASCVPDAGWLDHLLAPIVDEGERVVAGEHRSTGAPGLRDEVAQHRAGLRYLDEAPTINLAVTRAVLDEIGGLDETFRYGSDVDFTWRATDAGHPVRYAPEAVVAHDWGDARAEARRSYKYGKARMRLYAKHRARRAAALRNDPEAVVYPLYLLGLPLALRHRWYLALLAIPLVRNRRSRPLLTVAHHLIGGAGVLAELVTLIREGRR
jgi:hypothetical protein